MLIACSKSPKMPQDSVSPIQYSAMFIIYTNSRNLFGEEQTKFRVLKILVYQQYLRLTKSKFDFTIPCLLPFLYNHPISILAKGITVQAWLLIIFSLTHSVLLVGPP